MDIPLLKGLDSLLAVAFAAKFIQMMMFLRKSKEMDNWAGPVKLFYFDFIQLIQDTEDKEKAKKEMD
ncbi:MAG: hypothetical protein HRT57_05425 [Crocinitomicaceae bacterium]|nr:hypothetical protein [Crocinitomicaceae bacterium]